MQRRRSDEAFSAAIRPSFVSSDRTYGARPVWHDRSAEGLSCGLHRIERLVRLHGLKARPAGNVLDRQFSADAPNRR